MQQKQNKKELKHTRFEVYSRTTSSTSVNYFDKDAYIYINRDKLCKIIKRFLIKTQNKKVDACVRRYL